MASGDKTYIAETTQDEIKSMIDSINSNGVNSKPIKSIQRVTIPSVITISGAYSKEKYKDYTISSVDTSKAFVFASTWSARVIGDISNSLPDEIKYQSYGNLYLDPYAELVDSTTLRVFITCYYDYASNLSSDMAYINQGTYHIVEFY